MARKIKIRRGLKADMPTLDIAELGYAVDTKELVIGDESGNIYIAMKSLIGSLSSLNTTAKTDIVSAINSIQLSGGSVPTNVILFEDWAEGENVTIDTDIVDTTEPTVTASVSAGTYNSPQTVTLSANETATIYYTLDGSTPTISSAIYSTAITISQTTTLKFFGMDTAGNQSNVQSITYTIDTTAPNDVTGLTLGSPTENSIPVSWTLSTSTDVANYEVAYSSNSGATWTVASNSINPSSTSYTVNGLTQNTSYVVRVVTIDSVGNRSTGVTSEPVTTLVSTDITAPSIPSGLVATSGDTTIYLDWTNNTESDLSGYNVYQSTDNVNFTKINSSVVTVSNYNITNLTNGTTYYFKISALDTSSNESSQTTSVSSTPADTTVPVLTITPSATFSDTQTVTISATDNSGVTPTIYYTLDGSTPTTSSSVYSTALTLSATTTVKAFARDTAGNVSAVQTVIYTKQAIASGYVNDVSLLLYQASPANNSTISSPDNYFQGSGNFTVSLGAKFAVSGANASTLLLSRMSTNVMKIELTWQHKLTANLYGMSAGSAAYPALTPDNLFDDFTKYYHITLVRNGTSLTLYADDVQIATATIPADFVFNTSTASLVVGQSAKLGTYKNLVYYNRALTTEERTQNYNALK